MEVEITPAEREELADDKPYGASYTDGGKPRLKKKNRRESFRKTIQVYLANIDHTVRAPPVKPYRCLRKLRP